MRHRPEYSNLTCGPQRWFLLLVIASSVDVEGAVSVYWVTVGRRGIGAHSDSQDTWDGCDLLPDLLDVSGARFARLNPAPLGCVVEVQPHGELHDICGIVAEGHLHKLEKLWMAVPAVAMRRSVRATCAAMRTLQRCFRGAATTPACRPGRERAGSLRERRNAGARPKRIPQSSASATENERMGAFMRMTDSAGKESGDSTKGSRASQYDPATPRTAPVQEMTSASTSNWRTMRQRLAPIAVRIASSCRRVRPRASRRMEQLAQPMMSRRTTPASRSASVRARSCW